MYSHVVVVVVVGGVFLHLFKNCLFVCYSPLELGNANPVDLSELVDFEASPLWGSCKSWKTRSVYKLLLRGYW